MQTTAKTRTSTRPMADAATGKREHKAPPTTTSPWDDPDESIDAMAEMEGSLVGDAQPARAAVRPRAQRSAGATRDINGNGTRPRRHESVVLPSGFWVRKVLEPQPEAQPQRPEEKARHRIRPILISSAIGLSIAGAGALVALLMPSLPAQLGSSVGRASIGLPPLGVAGAVATPTVGDPTATPPPSTVAGAGAIDLREAGADRGPGPAAVAGPPAVAVGPATQAPVAAVPTSPPAAGARPVAALEVPREAEPGLATAAVDDRPPPTPAYQVPAAEWVNLRNGPSSRAAVASVIAPGTVVDVIACDRWCDVIADGQRGYVYAPYLNGRPVAEREAETAAAPTVETAAAPTAVEAPAAPAPAATPEPAPAPVVEERRRPIIDALFNRAPPEPAAPQVTTTTWVNMRAAPRSSSEVLRVVGPTTPLQVLGCQTWCQVVVDGVTGYIDVDYITGGTTG